MVQRVKQPQIKNNEPQPRLSGSYKNKRVLCSQAPGGDAQ